MKEDPQWWDIADDRFGRESTQGVEDLWTADLAEPGGDGTIEVRDSEQCSYYGFVSRPPLGESQAFALEVGGLRHIIGTRCEKGAEFYGALNPGDVALYSKGKGKIRLQADGSIGIIQSGPKYDSAISIQKDGTIIIANEWFQLELGKKGFIVSDLKLGQQMSITDKGFQMVGNGAHLTTAQVSLGVQAAKPFTVPPVGGLIIPNVFV